ncbi:Protein ASPARTIC PROTEASE IN GUARD CELL 1 [Morella rubra]|uniref:Protein ASPARTIC PROTEASE IN GUARD CELL 1 n=1 Tax=Morella rubra TaxID=262757 RepID=A0A6A1W8P0_9ROSI|nr:Protein ASPARTIC PROTEASE IN GUARD CELL 1 [Morella rubra]
MEAIWFLVFCLVSATAPNSLAQLLPGLGTPVKYYSLFLDTGSSFSWLQCKPCARYCHPQVDPLFDPFNSQTYKSLACTTSQCAALTGATHIKPYCASSSNACVYTSKSGDNSSSVGFLRQDSLTLSMYEVLPDFIYGCGQNNKGLFGFSAGIMGLARAKLSMTAQLSSKYGYAFTYCLPTPDHGKGFLSIGNSSMGAFSAYKFTNMLRDTVNPSLYFLSDESREQPFCANSQCRHRSKAWRVMPGLPKYLSAVPDCYCWKSSTTAFKIAYDIYRSKIDFAAGGCGLALMTDFAKPGRLACSAQF